LMQSVILKLYKHFETSQQLLLNRKKSQNQINH